MEIQHGQSVRSFYLASPHYLFPDFPKKRDSPNWPWHSPGVVLKNLHHHTYFTKSQWLCVSFPFRLQVLVILSLSHTSLLCDSGNFPLFPQSAPNIYPLPKHVPLQSVLQNSLFAGCETYWQVCLQADTVCETLPHYRHCIWHILTTKQYITRYTTDRGPSWDVIMHKVIPVMTMTAPFYTWFNNVALGPREAPMPPLMVILINSLEQEQMVNFSFTP